MLVRALATLSYLVPCLCKVYEDVADLPGLSYDFVIIGGGAAGNVVANLLEAGVSNEGVMSVIDSIVPFLVLQLLQPNIYEWNYTTTPQLGLNGRIIDYPRAHILGGCSAHIDGMIYTRGSSDDYNRYARVTGDPGWSWDRLLPYFFKNEKWTQPADHHNTRGQFDPSVHSTHGINSVSLGGFQWSPIFSEHIIQTTKELPEEFPFNLDMNSGNPEGLKTGWLQYTIGGGERSSSATSYLAPQFIQRKNLDVLLHAQVSRLVNSSRINDKLRFEGVEFAQGGSLFTAKARKEIILSAGAVGTPAILMHSGIGDQAVLNDLGIPSLLDLKSVGANARYRTTHVAFLRLDSESLGNFTDPSAGPHSPHIEIEFQPGPGSEETNPGNFMSARMIVLNPVSRGSVTIKSNNPFDAPAIDPAFLQNELDILTAREALKRVQRIVAAPVWRDYIIAPTQDLENISQDALDEFIRNNSRTAYHLVGTAAMSPRDANYGVVNPDLLVKGTTGLRIIDASVLPFIPAAHTQAATYVVAERAADLVKEAWGFPISN
ncbi:aryl-alcohol oxidase-like protein [Mycena leptocephala]|nr:aryl-alcohol oxidase-like protein [Mycena leptocephala]